MISWQFAPFAAVLLTSASALAQTPTLSKVDAPPSLVPLAATVGGRVLGMPGSPELVYQWPGTYFRTAFRGRELFFRVGTNHEILHVVVDGRAPLVLSAPQPGLYRLGHLRNERHEVTLAVATESQSAPNSFGGFSIATTEQPLTPPVRARQIEFIGDSHTVGYGNLSPKATCTPDEVWASTDDTQAFGALTAAHYNADYQVNAISGRGVVRNYNNSPGDTLPVAYPYTLLNKQQTYNDPSWKPEVLVIALGTNDFSTPLNAGEPWKTRDDLHADYEATYVRFLQSLRARNPDAYIILWATDKAGGEIEAEVAKVVAQARAQGESRLTLLPIDHLAFSGCHNHPSVTDDKLISDKLLQLIDAKPGIWAGK